MIDADFIGTTARLVPVRWSTSLAESDADRYSFQEARARRWAFVSSRPDGTVLREWSVSVSAMNDGATVLREFVQGGWGPGPFRWVPVAAHQSNALTPAQSLLASLDAASGMDTVDGWSPRSVVGPSAITLAAGVAVLPGAPVTVTVDVSGAATLTVTFRNGAGGVVSTQTSTAVGTLAQRLTYTAPSVPATARTVDVQVSGHIRAARPQVTWTDGVVPYAIGAASQSVVLTEASRSLRVIQAGSRDALWELSASMREVG